jgi:ubiquinol-cytochrome c reductase cytochrome b subunit
MVGVREVRAGQRLLRKADDRLGYASIAKSGLSKIFPDHWSFMLGEIALYSFLILVVTGVYMTFFFEASSALRPYTGSYAPLHGREVSAAFASTVEMSWDVRGGLLVRQAHHWAAHIFIGAIVLHLCRIFFTGMFRKPREMNWVIGVTLLLLAIMNAFFGYSLPDDLLSGTGLHIFYSVVEGIPFVGDWLTFLIFGGEFPGRYVVERLYPLHILVIPAVIAVLITAHLGILIKQKHSHFAGPGRSDANVVGSRVWPAYALRSMALLFAVTAVTLLAGGLAQINPIWVWGDFESSTITAPSVADWYIGWLEGALRLFPPIELHLLGFTVPNQFWPAVLLPGLTFLALWLWPWIDRLVTGDRAAHYGLTGRPREAPVRVGIGVAALTFYGVLLFACGEELWVEWTRLPIATVRTVERILVLVLPVVTGVVAWWVARALRAGEAEGALSMPAADLRRRRVRDHEAERAVREGASPLPVDRTAAAAEPGAVPGQRDGDESRRAVGVSVAEAELRAPDGRPLTELPFWLARGSSETEE